MGFRPLPPQRPPDIGRSRAGPHTRLGSDGGDRFAIYLQPAYSRPWSACGRVRLHGGKLNKARRKRANCAFPCRSSWCSTANASCSIPTRRCKARYAPVFELFARQGTDNAVVQRFHELGLRFPRRAYGRAWNGKLIWGCFTHESSVSCRQKTPWYDG